MNFSGLGGCINRMISAKAACTSRSIPANTWTDTGYRFTKAAKGIWTYLERNTAWAEKKKYFLLRRAGSTGCSRDLWDYFNEEIRSNIVPLMIEDIKAFPPSVIIDLTWPALSKKDKSPPKNLRSYRFPQEGCRFIILPPGNREKAYHPAGRYHPVLFAADFFHFWIRLFFLGDHQR